MLKVEDGKCELSGNGSQLILDLALAIKTLRGVINDANGSGDEAIDLALVISNKATMKMFEDKVS